MRNRLAPRDRLAVIGKTGQGKSAWLKNELLAPMVKARAPIVAFDPLDELSELGTQTEEVRLGPLTQKCTAAELEANPSLLDAHPLALAVVPEGQSQAEIAEEFETVAKLVKLTGSVAFVAEECGIFAEHCQSSLNLVATTYRHYGVAVVLSAQRLTQIPKTARAQLSEVIAFRTDDDDDLAQLARLTKSEEFAERVSRLSPGNFEHWRDSAAESAPNKRRAAK